MSEPILTPEQVAEIERVARSRGHDVWYIRNGEGGGYTTFSVFDEYKRLRAALAKMTKQRDALDKLVDAKQAELLRLNEKTMKDAEVIDMLWQAQAKDRATAYAEGQRDAMKVLLPYLRHTQQACQFDCSCGLLAIMDTLRDTPAPPREEPSR